MRKSIPTRYKDTLYRSELEARTACVLDNLNIKFEYEAISFEVHSKGNRITKSYTPDFFLPDAKVIIEMKGDYDKRSKENTDLIRRCMNQDVDFVHNGYRDENHYLQNGGYLIKCLYNGFLSYGNDFTYFVVDSDFYIIDYVSNTYTPFNNLYTYIPYALKRCHAYIDNALSTAKVENDKLWECLKFSTPTQLTDYLNQNSVKKDDVLSISPNSNNITIIMNVGALTQELFYGWELICNEQVEEYLNIGITQFIAEFYINNVVLKRLKDLALKSYMLDTGIEYHHKLIDAKNITRQNYDYSKYTDKFTEVININEHISLVFKPILEFKDFEYTDFKGTNIIVNDDDIVSSSYATFNITGCTLSYKEHSIDMQKIKFGEEITFNIEKVYQLIDYIKNDYIELIKKNQGIRK